MTAGLKEAFYLSQNKQAVDARLPGCVLRSLSPEKRSTQCNILWFQSELHHMQMGCTTVPHCQ